jgi:hypothetical protein
MTASRAGQPSLSPIEADTLPEMRRALIDILRDLERHGVRDARTGEVVQAGSVDQM